MANRTRRLTTYWWALMLSGATIGAALGRAFVTTNGAALFGLACAGAIALYTLDRLDPFHRYRRAFYTAMILGGFSGRPIGYDRCIILILEETPKYYRVYFPLWWRLNYTARVWLPKDSGSLEFIDR